MESDLRGGDREAQKLDSKRRRRLATPRGPGPSRGERTAAEQQQRRVCASHSFRGGGEGRGLGPRRAGRGRQDSFFDGTRVRRSLRCKLARTWRWGDETGNLALKRRYCRHGARRVSVVPGHLGALRWPWTGGSTEGIWCGEHGEGRKRERKEQKQRRTERDPRGRCPRGKQKHEASRPATPGCRSSLAL